jgi:ribosomal protein L11 methyltransferase
MFKQITINIDSKNADKLSDIFMELNALSVSTEDQYEGTDLEQAIFNEPGMIVSELWEHSKVNILFASNIEIDGIINKAYLLLGKTFEYSIIDVDDQDWVRLTQSQFEPIKVNDKLYIVPSWHELPDKNAMAIVLDPGLAFGTGSHATTFMCLDWITQNINKNAFVIDYGCGSGILAIAAKKFGAAQVYGIDIDKQAIEASQYNTSQNNVDVELYLPSQLPDVSANIVIANILSNPLRLLAPALAKLTTDKLVLSGILDSQIEEMSEIYAKWFDVRVAHILDGWVLLECSKRGLS